MEFAELIQVSSIEGVVLRRPHCPAVEGSLCVTGHHLLLLGKPDHNEELLLLHSAIDTVEKRLAGAGGSLLIHCKNLRYFRLDIAAGDDVIKLAATLTDLANIENVSLKYPFFYRPTFAVKEDGWSAFAPEAEFNRLIANNLQDWRISHANKGFQLCSSYPEAVVMPRSVDDATIVNSSAFRQGGRFPVLCYFHADNQAVMMRASQPLVGDKGRRCRDDEQLMNATLVGSRRGYVLDTRSPSLTKTAQLKGGGVEPEVYYPRWKRVHQVIDRVSGLHESFAKLVEATSDTTASSERWLSRLDTSGWMSGVKDVLTCACLVAQCMDRENANVLVHGGEGVDTTLQVTALTQVLLDPDCRSLRGFEALVDREWVQAGHPFQNRCRKSAKAVTSHKQEAPSFLLFLDTVWQVWQQFPCSFEFNEDFLVLLFEHAYSSDFGTFLGNSQKERKLLDVPNKTISLWTFVNRPEVLERYMNPLYDPNRAVIWPSVAPQSLQLWSVYLRWVLPCRPDELAQEAVSKMKTVEKDLRSFVGKLRRVLVELEKEAMEADLIPAHTPKPVTSGGRKSAGD